MQHEDDGAAAAPPDGFRLWRGPGPFIQANGPLYHRQEADGGFRYGFRAERRHGNFDGAVHGGWLFSVADQISGRVLFALTRQLAATVSSNVAFVAPVRTGDWVEGSVEPVRIARSLAFLRVELTVAGRRVLTASSVWRLLGERRKPDGEAGVASDETGGTPCTR